MANTIDRKINPEIPIVQESNRNEVYVPNASYTEPGVAGFFKTHFIVDDNGIVHLRKAPERAVSGITYDSNTNTLTITFDDGTVQDIKLNNCACVDGVDFIVYDTFNVITFKETSWNTLDASKVLVISAALTGYDNDEIIAQLDKYNVVITNVGDESVTSNYRTDAEYQIYKCTDGSLVIFATEAFAGRFIILKREFAVQKNVANITYDDATGMLTIYYVTGDPVTLPIKSNIEPGTGVGAVQQLADPKYNGKIKAATKNTYAKVLDSTLTDEEQIGAQGDYAVSIGGNSSAQGKRSVGAGTSSVAKGAYSHSLGDNTVTTSKASDSTAHGYQTTTDGKASHAEGSYTVVLGQKYVEGMFDPTPSGEPGGEPSEPSETPTDPLEMDNRRGEAAHAEGFNSYASGFAAHAEGISNVADGHVSKVSGRSNRAWSYLSRVDGYQSSIKPSAIIPTATGEGSYANGSDIQIVGAKYAYAGGENGRTTEAAHDSFSHGKGLVTNGKQQTFFGRYNKADPGILFGIGYGVSDTERRNAFDVYEDGTVTFRGAQLLPQGVLLLGEGPSSVRIAGLSSEKMAVRVADLGQNIVFPYGEHSVTYDTTDGITITGTMRIYIKKTDNDSTSVYHDVENVSMAVPLVAGDNVTIDADETGKKVIVKAEGGGSIEFPITYSAGNDGPGSTGAVLDAAYTSGYPGRTMIRGAYNSYQFTLSPYAVSITNGINTVSMSATGITYGSAAFLRSDNVKTLFGNQSIYGSGNIDIYKHNISLTNTSNKNMSFQLISSNNLVVDSLTDLKTLTNEKETFAAFGQCLYNNSTEIIIGVGKTSIYSTDGANVHTQSWASFMGSDTFYWSDTVTTV